jgi:hypothetical protein
MYEKYDVKSTNDEFDSCGVFHYHINDANQDNHTRYELPARRSRVKIRASLCAGAQLVSGNRSLTPPRQLFLPIWCRWESNA